MDVGRHERLHTGFLPNKIKYDNLLIYKLNIKHNVCLLLSMFQCLGLRLCLSFLPASIFCSESLERQGKGTGLPEIIKFKNYSSGCKAFATFKTHQLNNLKIDNTAKTM